MKSTICTRAIVGAVATLATAGAAAAGTPARMIESFSGPFGEVASVDPGITHEYGAISGDFTNVTTGGGKVYYQSGVNIYSADPDLGGATFIHANGVAPTDIAVDASRGLFYESFAGLEVAVVNTSFTHEYNAISGDFSNIAIGANKVYLQSGLNIYDANPDLTGLTLLHTNGLAPADIAVDSAGGYFYESFGGPFGEIAAVSLDFGHEYNAISGDFSNITFGGGKVYFQSGLNIYEANPDLSGFALLHTNGLSPADIAYLPATVPEPAAWAVMLLGFAVVGGSLRAKRPARA